MRQEETEKMKYERNIVTFVKWTFLSAGEMNIDTDIVVNRVLNKLLSNHNIFRYMRRN